MAADGKRRLPVLQNKEDEGDERPPWHWSAIGAVAIVLVWLPLSMLSGLIARRTYARYVPGDDAAATARAIEAMSAGQKLWLGFLVVLGPLVSLALAAFAGGVMVGRFGGRAGKREAAVAGLSAAGVSAALSAPAMLADTGPVTWAFTAAFLLGLAALAAYFGGTLGLRLRR